MVEALEIAGNMKDLRIPLDRLQKMAIETSQQVTQHEESMKRLDSEKLSQTLLDNALRGSEFLNWELGSLARSFESLKNGSLSRAEDEELANRLRKMGFSNQPSIQILSDRQNHFDAQLSQFSETHDQFRAAVQQHITLEDHVSDNTTQINTIANRISLLREKYLESEDNTRKDLGELKIKLEAFLSKQFDGRSQPSGLTEKLRELDVIIHDISQQGAVVKTELQDAVQSFSILAVKFEDLESLAQAQGRRIDALGNQQSLDRERIFEDLSTTKNELAALRCLVQPSGSSIKAGKQRMKESVSNQTLIENQVSCYYSKETEEVPC